MSPRHRTLAPLFVCLAALLTVASGCIVVVDDDGFGRNRSLHGTSWHLSFIFAHGHHYRVQQSDPYGITFSSSEELTGSAGCASFTADYDLSDSSIRINRFRSSTLGCTQDEVQSLFLEYLPAVTEVNMSDESLELLAGDGAQLVFER
ncbi:MAG: META domain-containing protein [Rhodothermales bacterium]|nr:META domain-containing protein [Rhodothermales bacterium]